MFKCNNCGKTFDEPVTHYESHGLDSPPFERLEKCPYCFSMGFEEATKENPEIEKTIVAEGVLNALYKLQRFINDWRIGQPIRDIEDVQGELVDMLVNIYDGGQDYADKLFNITTFEEAQDILSTIAEAVEV